MSQHKLPHNTVGTTDQLCFRDATHRLRCLLPEEFSTLNSLVNHDPNLLMLVGVLLRERDFGRDLSLKINRVQEFSPHHPDSPTWHIPLPFVIPTREGMVLTLGDSPR
ncbi:MAG: hypothetical protein HQL63_06625 [Magnetococcales bacterium]|nr:hypothetical protein [Magnetococcales bacterium]MBF0321839.1 hypothetical protein [Magnetococcales bacterium]